MNCPKCDSVRIRTVNTRHDTVESVVRDRKCLRCEHKWFTCEIDLPRHAVKWGDAASLKRVEGYRKVVFS